MVSFEILLILAAIEVGFGNNQEAGDIGIFAFGALVIGSLMKARDAFHDLRKQSGGLELKFTPEERT